MGFFTGKKGRYEQRSTLSPQQQPLFDQLQQALQGKGAGGAFGQAADYYRDLYSPDSQAFNQFAAPELRQFREDIIPGLSEQFAGMGSGALSSSGFRNAGIQASTDLSERLGALRQQLRQQGIQGMTQLGQFGLSPQFQENIYRPGQPGLLDTALPVAGQVAGSIFGGPIGGAIGGAAGSWLSGKFGKSNPYGQGSASAQQPAYYPGGQ